MAGEKEATEWWESIIEPHKEELLFLSGPVTMAQFFANTKAAGTNAEMQLRIPVAAEEWAESVLNSYFEVMGKIAKASGIRRKLIDRGLYDLMDDGAPDWNEGLTLNELDPIEREEGVLDEFEEEEVLDEVYGPFAPEPSFLRRFGDGDGDEVPLSGQYNRLFPVKLVLRTAANLFRARNEYSLLGL